MAASSSGGIGLWRTAFLSLRDETLTTPPPPRLSQLLQDLIFSHSHSLLSASSDLPIREVTSDSLFLLELVAKSYALCSGDDQDVMITVSLQTCQLIHDVCLRVSLQMNSASWSLILDSCESILDFLLRLPSNKPAISCNSNAYALRLKPVMQCLESLRRLTTPLQRKCSLSENVCLVKFLLHVIASLHEDLIFSYQTNQSSAADIAKKLSRYGSLWDVLALAFDMLGDAFSASESLFPTNLCQSTVEELRKVTDILSSKSQLVEENFMSRFYSSLLRCLHLVLIEPRCPISDHVSSFVAALRMFFSYGLASTPQRSFPDVVNKDKHFGFVPCKLVSEERKSADKTPYKPPHLRKRESLNVKQLKAWESCSVSDHESSAAEFTSSDSDYSDCDGSLRDSNSGQSSKVRVAAIVCLQDLCQADRKSFTTQWITLLPTSDVLKPRKFETTLMTCLLFDPHLKVRIVSASTLATMLDGHSSVFLQVAEYRESTKYGSFMPLSSSLGLILMQLHTGVLHLIQRETNGRLLASLFKILVLLISCTPYSRLPGELLPRVIISLRTRVTEGFPFKNDQTGLLVAAISCLTAAFSTTPQTQVRDMLLEEISAGFAEAERKSGILFTLFRYSEQLTNMATCFEALQVLRTVAHNYPTLMSACWQRVSTIVYKLLKSAPLDVPSRTWKAPARDSVGFIGEKITTSAIKVLDECLRAISGFKGTEDILDDKMLDPPFTSDCIRSKKVSSAPSYGHEDPQHMKEPNCQSGSELWSGAIEKHLPLVLQHYSAMVRGASVTCFAGITSSVFFSLKKEDQSFITSSVVNAALHDEAPAVRSAACRAIGVISCFPEISRSAKILDKFIQAIETNTHDPLISVRITASWALANICDFLRHSVNDFPLEQSRGTHGSNVASQSVELLIECALRLSQDGDKVKSNAVRALGNISRSVKFAGISGVHNKVSDPIVTSSTTDKTKVRKASSLNGSHQHISNAYYRTYVGNSNWLERTVQAFLSCITTGNVKVQWNVCHALSNLFLNETIELQHMDWAPSVFSILLLLLRDSSNFKIRIQAAAALAVPTSASDYGKSFADVVQGVEHILENLSLDRSSVPSNIKYRVALEKQLTSTMLHLLSLIPSSDHQSLLNFLLKKSSFLEDWLKSLWSSLVEESGTSSAGSQKKEMISKAIQSLAQIYEARNHHAISQKFHKLHTDMPEFSHSFMVTLWQPPERDDTV